MLKSDRLLGTHSLHKVLVDAGAVPSLIAPRLGPVTTTDGVRLDATAILENSPPVLFDALVLPDGEAGVNVLAELGQIQEFVVNQYRHCKTIRALGASRRLLDAAGVLATLPSGAADPGVVVATARDVQKAAKLFVQAVGKHRHTARDSDPPLV